MAIQAQATRNRERREVARSADSAIAAGRHEAPLLDLLSEIRGLGELRDREQISAVEYELRRRQVLTRI